MVFQSYRHVSTYIVTQYPLPQTMVDFYRLIFDHNISIVMLIETIPRDPVEIRQILFCFYH